MIKKIFIPTYEIPQGSQIVIYGAGSNGRKLYDLMASKYEIMAIFDRNAENILDYPIKVQSVTEISRYTYCDYIVVSIANEKVKNEVLKDIKAVGYDNCQIKTIDDFVYYKAEELNPIISVNNTYKVKIGINMGFSALGDQIIALHFVNELIKEFPRAEITIFSMMIDFSEAVFKGNKNVCRIEKYSDNIDFGLFDLFVSVVFEVLIKHINYEKLIKENASFVKKIEKQVEYQKKYYVDNLYATYTDRIYIDRARKLGINRYKLIGCKLFELGNELPKINIDELYMNEYEECNINGCYITMNFGANGVVGNKNLQTKMWKFEYYPILIELLHTKYPGLQILQLGTKDAEVLHGVDKAILGKSLEVVKFILKKSVLHIDCEGGLVHLATHLGTKCAVLFGPTPIDFYGYEQNINIAPRICGDCMGLSKDYSHDCIFYDEPICMQSITPEYVFEIIVPYLDSVLK